MENMLKLLIGTAGTGKTYQTGLRAVASANCGNRVIWLVPEQFSFETEQEVCRQLSGQSLYNLSVYSFSRLAENVFRCYGGLATRELSDTLKVVLMKLAIGEVRDLLQLYRRPCEKSYFISTMLQTVEALKQAGITPEQLHSLIGEMEGEQLSGKLREIHEIYQAYQALVERSFSDPSDRILRAARLTAEYNWFAGADIYIDGFSFFSPAERECIYVMMEQAADVTVTLCMDELSLCEGVDPFYDQKMTARKLISYAKAHFVKVSIPEKLEDCCRTGQPGLLAAQQAALGKNILPEQVDGLWIIQAETPYNEARFVSSEIMRLVREEGLRFREIAVVCRELDSYRMMLHACLDKDHIPYFIDRKISAVSKPVLQTVLSALRAVRRKYAAEAVLELVRSPATGLQEETAAEIENYVYIWSIESNLWKRPFTNNPDGNTGMGREYWQQRLDRIEAGRRKVIEPLERLERDLAVGGGKAFSAAIYQYFQDTQALEQLKLYYEQSGDSSNLQSNNRLWEELMNILDFFSESEQLEGKDMVELAELLELALSRVQLGQIPATKDQVLIGAADQVRFHAPKAVFVLGNNDGVFPRTVDTGGIFTDAERRIMELHGVELASPSMQLAMQERFYLYHAWSASSQYLYLLCPEVRAGGMGHPSPMLNRLMTRYPQRVKRTMEMSALFFASNPEAALEEYAARLTKQGRDCATIAAALEAEKSAEELDAIRQLQYGLPAKGITPQTAARLIGEKLRLSPSRIETFYRCPYQYFCNYMLRLSPRRKVAYTPLESGSAIHYVLEQLLAAVGEKGITPLTDGQLDEMIARFLQQYVAGITEENAALAARFRYQMNRLCSILRYIIRQIGREFDQSRFSAAGMEVAVGEDGPVKPVTFRINNQTEVVVSGKIDRVDSYEDESGKYIRVVDYKSGGKSFRLEDIALGLNMQMLIYLFAVCDDTSKYFGEVQPAGILYMPGNLSPVEDSSDHRTVEDRINAKLRMNGLLLNDERILRAMEEKLGGLYIPAKLDKNGNLSGSSSLGSQEEFAVVRKTVYENIRKMAQDLLSGMIAPLPVKTKYTDACANCDYLCLCGYREGGACRTDYNGKERDQ